jgi:hypothetical protein
MDHRSSGRFARNVAAFRRCSGADAANTSGTPNVPQIKSRAAENRRAHRFEIQFRLGDCEVDLLKAFSLDGSDGIGSACKVPSVGNFQERFGRW